MACAAISGARKSANIHAQWMRCHAILSCHAPTNPNTTHTFKSLYLAPPRGTYMYRTSHLLYDACHPFQKPRMVALLLMHRSMFSGASTPDASAQSRKNLQMAVNFSHIKLRTISDSTPTSNGPYEPKPTRSPHSHTLDLHIAFA